jgi:hypothetical protein
MFAQSGTDSASGPSLGQRSGIEKGHLARFSRPSPLALIDLFALLWKIWIPRTTANTVTRQGIVL